MIKLKFKKGVHASLTMDEKKRRAQRGEKVSVCVRAMPKERNSFISKIRGSIFDGSINLKNSRL